MIKYHVEIEMEISYVYISRVIAEFINRPAYIWSVVFMCHVSGQRGDRLVSLGIG